MSSRQDDLTVWAVCAYSNLEADLEGADVVALYLSKQTAKQHADRGGSGYYVQKKTVYRALRDW